MTYNTPELLLIGAAQNLVLGTSDDPQFKNDSDCQRGPGDADGPTTYDGSTTW